MPPKTTRPLPMAFTWSVMRGSSQVFIDVRSMTSAWGKACSTSSKKGPEKLFSATLVTMELDDEALPIRSDAELKIRPRIFLEGNFFVDLEPGTPEGEQLDEGDTIPMTQTAAPVQLDQVLGVLKTDARKDLQTLVQGYGEAISGEPTAAEDATQDPDVRGKTAAEVEVDFSHGWWFLGGDCSVRDIWDKKDVGTTKQVFKKRLDSHDVAFLRLKPLKK